MLRCLVARLGDERYAIPVTNVVETVALKDSTIHTVAGVQTVDRDGVPGAARGPRVPSWTSPASASPLAAVVVRHGGGGADQMAWTVDRLVGEQEIVVKDLGGFLDRPPGLTGATIDSDGTLMLLVDVRELAERALSGRRDLRSGRHRRASPANPPCEAGPEDARPRKAAARKRAACSSSRTAPASASCSA